MRIRRKLAPKSVVVAIRLDKSDYDRLLITALKQKLTVGQYIKQRIEKKLHPKNIEDGK